jgi:uncharacterized protein (UPF0333 family)
MIEERLKSKGSVLLEVALILPLLLIILSGIIEFGFILGAKIAVNSAAYEAARAATINDNIEKSALEAISSYPGATLPGWNFEERLSATIESEGNEPGDKIRILVNYDVPIIFPIISSFLNIDRSGFKITGISVMSIEEKE